MGSGHILVYAFDVLIQIYKKYGVSERDAAQSILQNNLYGLDIDDRAAQLAYFAVMMKARQYDRRIFSRGIQPHVYAIVESNGLDNVTIDYFTNNDPKLKKDFGTLVDELRDAKEYGSILNITPVDFAALYARVEEVREEISLYRENVLSTVLPLIQVAEVMARKYDVVVTNPPYMGSSNMDAKLSEFAKKHYPNSKSDLFACFIEKGNRMVGNARFNCMVTMQSWMFLSSFEKMRTQTLMSHDIVTLMHMENMVLGIAFGTAVTVFRNHYTPGYKGTYNQIKLCDIENGKPIEFPVEGNRFAQVSTDNFSKIPGSPVAYWVSNGLLEAFDSGKSLDEIALARNGMKTGENGRFVRLWWEVAIADLNLYAKDWKSAVASKAKWFPYNKGGEYRKWYGNNDCIVNWENQGNEIFNHAKADKRNVQDYPLELKFIPSVSWSLVTSGQPAFRYKVYNLSDIAGMSFFTKEPSLTLLLGFCNSKIALEILRILAPTINFQAGDIGRLPIVEYGDQAEGICNLVSSNIALSKDDWDSYEPSWDFQRHSLLSTASRLVDAYTVWKSKCEQHFLHLKANEEELNRIFIDIYGLQDELTPEVEDKDVTVHRIFDTKDDVPESMQGSNYVRTMRDEIVSLISYAVGCMFGRYSLDVEGLAYAGGDWDASKYTTIIPDTDNIIPICDDDYFDDDITGRFVKWVEAVYGSDTLEENLKFIADALGGKGTPREVIRSYFLNDFYADHCKTYQKRPIYWLFDSGKKNGFKALIYMHRYQSDLLARMRTDYVHEQQERYRTQLAHLADALEHASGSERVKLTKKQKALQDQSLEIQKYEEKIHHLADQNISIDLDDGVKHNYALFADVLAKTK